MGVENGLFWSENGVRICSTRWHTPTKIYREIPAPPPQASHGDQCVIRWNADMPKNMSAGLVSKHVWRGLPSHGEECNDGISVACVYVPEQPWRKNVSSQGAPVHQRVGERSSLVRMGGKACHLLVKGQMMA